MTLSARNQLPGTVKSVVLGSVVPTVVVVQVAVAAITLAVGASCYLLLLVCTRRLAPRK